MDGCSTAIDSHFAAVLSARVLRKAATEISYQYFISGKQPVLQELERQLLHRKLIHIQAHAGLKPLDDLAMVRLIL